MHDINFSTGLYIGQPQKVAVLFLSDGLCQDVSVTALARYIFKVAKSYIGLTLYDACSSCCSPA